MRSPPHQDMTKFFMKFNLINLMTGVASWLPGPGAGMWGTYARVAGRHKGHVGASAEISKEISLRFQLLVSGRAGIGREQAPIISNCLDETSGKQRVRTLHASVGLKQPHSIHYSHTLS
jgi:hypothetical protein